MKYEEFLSKVRKRARFASNEEAENAIQATFAKLLEVENEGEIPELGTVAEEEEENTEEFE